MDEFPTNNHSSRVPVPEEPVKEIKRIVTSEVVRRRRPLGARIKDMFVAGDSKSVGQYLVADVLLPAVKDMVADAVSQGIERMIFGESRSTSRRTGSRPSSGNNGYVSYNRFAAGGARTSAPMQTRKARASHDFDQIVIPTRPEAEAVIDAMFEAISKYESASVADLYELVGITPEFTDQKWGWSDFRGAGVTRISNGYLLDLPKPDQLD